jgi:hypothetical protein
MTTKIAYRWLLRERMAERGMWKTTELIPLLAERGIELSATQVYRLVTSDPGTVVAAGARRALRHLGVCPERPDRDRRRHRNGTPQGGR